MPGCIASTKSMCLSQQPQLRVLCRFEGLTREGVPHGKGVLVMGNGTGGGFSGASRGDRYVDRVTTMSRFSRTTVTNAARGNCMQIRRRILRRVWPWPRCLYKSQRPSVQRGVLLWQETWVNLLGLSEYSHSAEWQHNIQCSGVHAILHVS